jgi:hypothetical protein
MQGHRKIGVSVSILNKPVPYRGRTEDNAEAPEIGYKIAMSSLEFSSIADYILCIMSVGPERVFQRP